MISWAYEKEIIIKAQFRWIRLYIPLDPVPQSWVFEKSSHRFSLVFRINFCFLLRPRRFVKFLFVTCPNPAIIVREFLSINLPASSSSQGRQTGDAIETVGFSLCSGMDSSSLIQGLLLATGRSSYLHVLELSMSGLWQYRWLYNLIKTETARLWQYGLWSFQMGGTKLERFLPKNQHM